MMSAKLDGVVRERVVRTVVEVILGCFVLALLGYVGYWLHVSLYTASLIYLLITVFATVASGLRVGTILSLSAAVCLDYFYIPPVLHFNVANASGWMALITFEVCALVIGRMSSRERQKAGEVAFQQKSIRQLYALSRGTALLALRLPLGPQLVCLIRQSFEAENVAVFDAEKGRLDRDGPWTDEEAAVARSAYLQNKNHDDPDKRIATRLLLVGRTCVGAIAVQGDVNGMIADALATLAAMPFERARSFEKEHRAEAATKTEQLRGVVLDALAHAFKTPLTAIRIASSGLLESGDLSPMHTELVSLIDAESLQLADLCNRLLQTAKLEKEKIGIVQQKVNLVHLVEEVREGLSESLKGHPITVSIPELQTVVDGDKELLLMILIQYLDNASKYSDPGTAIDVSIYDSSSNLLVAVRNQGPVIPVEDRERIFERFYRCPETERRAEGTGLGLSIVKKAADAHNGHVWVISAENEGTTFYLSLPNAELGDNEYGLRENTNRR
jgi:two-component system sensor histidine kinase KdpD